MTWAEDVRRANEALDWIEARQGPLKPDGYARIETTVQQVRAMSEQADDARYEHLLARLDAVTAGANKLRAERDALRARAERAESERDALQAAMQAAWDSSRAALAAASEAAQEGRDGE